MTSATGVSLRVIIKENSWVALTPSILKLTHDITKSLSKMQRMQRIKTVVVYAPNNLAWFVDKVLAASRYVVDYTVDISVEAS